MMRAHSEAVDATGWISDKSIQIAIPFHSLFEIAEAFRKSCEASKRTVKRELKIMGSPKQGDALLRYAVRNFDGCLRRYDDVFEKRRGRRTRLNRNVTISAFLSATFPDTFEPDELATKTIGR
jgi:hypothetical protein